MHQHAWSLIVNGILFVGIGLVWLGMIWRSKLTIILSVINHGSHH